MTKQNTKVEFHIKCKMILKQKKWKLCKKIIPTEDFGTCTKCNGYERMKCGGMWIFDMFFIYD